MRIEVPIPEEIKIVQSVALAEFIWNVTAEIYGVERDLATCSNFRVEPSFLSFDLEPNLMFGDQLVKDINSGQVQARITIKPETVHGEITEGPVIVQLVGRLNVPEAATTACDEVRCRKVFPVMDAYRSLRFPERQICPECFERGKGMKRFKEVESGKEESGINFGNIPARPR
jgi:hypothetical protein